jgi:hypothetical protein
MFLGQEESTLDERTIRTVGTFHHVLLSGLVLQWLIDPASALSAKNLKTALQATAATLEPKKKTTRARAKINPQSRTRR